jgi:diguanylate cyclase (GGDEF)-like protein
MTLAILAFAAVAITIVDRATRQVAVRAAQDLGEMLAEWSSGPLERHDWASLNSLARLHATNPGLLFVTFVVRDDVPVEGAEPQRLRAIRTTATLEAGDALPYNLPDWALVKVPVWSKPESLGPRRDLPLGEVHLGIDPARSYMLVHQARTWFWGTAALLGSLLLSLMVSLYRRVTREAKATTRDRALAPGSGPHDDQSENRERAVREVEARLERETEMLRDLAARDPLTGLYNRRHFDEVFAARFEESRRYGDDLCLAVMDLDDFKRVNDLYGHTAGDAALVTLATTIQAEMRAADICARYGGDEFVVLMPQTNLEDAVHVLHRFQSKFRETCRERFPELPVTLSVGVVQSGPLVSAPENLFAHADGAMYEAKGKGKHCICATRITDPTDGVHDSRILSGF